jgi:hypothetical protein
VSEQKTYGRKDNAIAACRKAGFDPNEFEFVQAEGGRWTWQAKGEPGDEVAPKQVEQASDEIVVRMMADEDDYDYGEARLSDARRMAQEFAKSDGTAIKLLDPMTDEVVETIEPPPAAEPVNVPAGIAPGFGVNANGDLVELPSAGEDMFKPPSDTLAWDTVPAAPVEPVLPVDQPTAAPTPTFEEPVVVVPLTVGEGQRFMLCIEGNSFPQSSPEAWALEFARKLKVPVVIRDAETFEVLRHVAPVSKSAARQAAKAGKPAGERKPRGGPGRMKKTEPEGMVAQMIEMATRRDGVTRPELAAKLSSKNQPWTALLKSAADRWGYEFSSERPGKNTVYKLTKIEAVAAE